ncbi:MAG: hypothetical protein AB1773_16710, partial [Pseudomonadota bacterium]
MSPGFSPEGRLTGTGIRINPGDLVVPVYAPRVGVGKSITRQAGTAGYANAGGFDDPTQWALAGYRVYRAGSAAIGNEALVPGQAAASNTDVTFEQKHTLADLSAGDSANVITAQDASLVEAGAGDDSVAMGVGYFFAGPDWERALDLSGLRDPDSPSEAQARYFAAIEPSLQPTFFGERENSLGGFTDAGAGNDTVNGSTGQDTIVGAEGDDALDGKAGSDRYLFTASETGIDSLSDSGLDALSYLDYYYWSRGILNWDERQAHANEWRVAFEGGRRYFATQGEALDYIQNATSGAGALAFIAPLPEAAPLLTRNDTALLDQLTTAGVLDRDAVEFGPGLTLADLVLDIRVDAAVALDHPGQPWFGGGVLSVRWNGGAAGFDVQVPDV